MSAGVPYTRYHPRWYRRRVSVWWWLQKWSYARFVLRELTSLAVAFFALLMLAHLYALGAGPQAYSRLSAWMGSRLFLVLNGLAFVFLLFHSITWFNLAPKAIVLRVRGQRLPDLVVSGLNYVAWLAASAGVAWLLLRG